MYGWQAGSRHPTGMLSSLITVSRDQFGRGNISSYCQIQQISKMSDVVPSTSYYLWGCGGRGREVVKLVCLCFTYPGGNRRLQHQTDMLIQSCWYGDNPTGDVSLPWQLTAVINTGPSVIEGCCKQERKLPNLCLLFAFAFKCDRPIGNSTIYNFL